MLHVLILSKYYTSLLSVCFHALWWFDSYLTLTLVLGPLLETIWGSLDLQCDFSNLDTCFCCLLLKCF